MHQYAYLYCPGAARLRRRQVNGVLRAEFNRSKERTLNARGFMSVQGLRPCLVVSAWCLALMPPAGSAFDGGQGVARVVTDYIYRNYSRSADQPALQVQYARPLNARFSAGVGISTVNFDDARWELTAYVSGIAWARDDWRLVMTAAGYFYDGEMLGNAAHYAEPSAVLWYGDNLSLKVGSAIDLYGLGESSVYTELAGRYPLSDMTSIGAAAGFERLHAVDGEDHTYWNLGLTHYFTARLALDLRYYGSRSVFPDRHTAGADLLEPRGIRDRVVLGVSVSF